MNEVAAGQDSTPYVPFGAARRALLRHRQEAVRPDSGC
jgi:hypothetical protein